eukprot:TRINITY_DN1612_c0_g2_i1.p1 TRINITY_DN1612_c0_g2~~TRINITY_DN1612_c0_g2_i1.p1  ORF type:complete len:553 (+),score=115.18 TRINITY_DN1612_c0_g2_i1:2-1660(+)
MRSSRKIRLTQKDLTSLTFDKNTEYNAQIIIKDKTSKITCLECCYTKIDSVDKKFLIEFFPLLKKLKIRKNMIEFWPKNLIRLDFLVVLDLSNNLLSDVPDGISRMRNLEKLNLSGNRIERIPESIAMLGSLEELLLDDNEIKVVPFAVSLCGSLRVLGLKGNYIVSPFIGHVKKMNVLEVLREIPNDGTEFSVDLNDTGFDFLQNDVKLFVYTHVSSIQGRREYMEDKYLAIPNFTRMFVLQNNKKGEFKIRKSSRDLIAQSRAHSSDNLEVENPSPGRIPSRRLSNEITSARSKRRKTSRIMKEDPPQNDEWTNTLNGRELGLYAVFDGHGGDRAALYCKKRFHKNIFRQKEYIMQDLWVEALSQAVCLTDKEYIEQLEEEEDDGTTLVGVLQVKNHLYIANVGDSRAVICRGDQAIPLTDDHKPNRPDEQLRIEMAGGEVVSRTAVPRVNGVLSVSRAIGDVSLKDPIPIVIPDPEMNTYTLTPEDRFLVIASDGIWDVMSNDDVISYIRKRMFVNRDCIADLLTEKAKNLGSNDNITAVIVWFDWLKK